MFDDITNAMISDLSNVKNSQLNFDKLFDLE